MNQSPSQSALETTCQVGFGLAVSYVFTLYGLPLFGIHPSAHDAGLITAAYAVLSWLRGYLIRRCFA